VNPQFSPQFFLDILHVKAEGSDGGPQFGSRALVAEGFH
jgi:hypothetical protein